MRFIINYSGTTYAKNKIKELNNLIGEFNAITNVIYTALYSVKYTVPGTKIGMISETEDKYKHIVDNIYDMFNVIKGEFKKGNIHDIDIDQHIHYFNECKDRADSNIAELKYLMKERGL